ncbi:scavenger receptor cysteine-rich type 1 protein M130-like [Sardina pilchardus]|uniref:scavenger receptor cysteine-rich type 1 protein M130-like n=1 Tax=Sardina pilchardus TaxID=27697 RepID=UPI002E0D8A65
MVNTVRLVNGSSQCSGRVEVYHAGEWGTVCDLWWDMTDAAVVCRELGCGDAVETLSGAHFGEGSGRSWMTGVRCEGSESRLKNCEHMGWRDWSTLRCPHSRDAGVTCSDTVRLVNGGSRCSGRVEVYHAGEWGTVCDHGWDMADAAVVCRELECGVAVEALSGAHFGEGSGRSWIPGVRCEGSESRLKNCEHGGWRDWSTEGCPHSRDAGVTCSDTVRLVNGSSQCSGRVEVYHAGEWGTVCDDGWDMDNAAVVCRELGCDTVRLVNGSSRCSGRVEVYHAGEWGTVCDDGWDMADAAVVCRELDCGDAVETLSGAHVGEGSGRSWMTGVRCEGSESRLKNCEHGGWRDWSTAGCPHSRDAGVTCSGVQLVGRSHCSGRVELLHKKTRHTVCSSTFDQQDAEVVCRQLGCGAPVEVLGAAAFGEGEGQVWSEEIQCGGNETQIHLCPTSSTPSHNCSHKHDVGLVCTDPVRLVDGPSRCSGRVELYHVGEWGTVCGADWDYFDTAVVCKELGCGDAVDSFSDVHFGEGAGRVLMAEVGCVGWETRLKSCSHKGLGEHTCQPKNNVGVTCSEHRAPRLVTGSHRCSGRVEVEHGTTWGTVCNATFDWQDAEVVCRQLGCGAPVEVLGAAAFGEGEGQVWSEEIQCGGNETQIQLCPTSPMNHNCSHEMDVGLLCSDFSVLKQKMKAWSYSKAL